LIALQLPSPTPPRCAPKQTTAPSERERARTGGRPAKAPPTVTTQFLPLDPDIVSDAIPAFFIGRSKQGFWVARDANGQIGGIFLLESSALSFARSIAGPQGAQQYFRPGRSNSIAKTRAIRLSRSWDH
jgi:hypothetical protein